MSPETRQLVDVYGGCGFLIWFRDLWIDTVSDRHELAQLIGYRTRGADRDGIAARLVKGLIADGWVTGDETRLEINRRNEGVRAYARDMGFHVPTVRKRRKSRA